MHYDYVIVGSGLFGAVFAHEAVKADKRVLVIERRGHTGGNIHCEERDGIDIHLYGAHIFHTCDEKVWRYINQFTAFNHYRNSPIARYQERLFNLPFNMNTFHQMWSDVYTPEEAKARIEEQRKEVVGEVTNLEQQAISLVGRDIYETLIKGYTEKQWGRPCTELPPSIIKRLPVRWRYDNNYFNDPHQGIPIAGYNSIIEQLLEGITVVLNTDFNADRTRLSALGDKVLYTGALDAYYDYRLGKLEYRSVHFDHQRVEGGNQQGVAVINYTDANIPYTRSIEHAHFTFTEADVSWVSYEYPVDYSQTGEPYYPIGDEQNLALHRRYRALAEREGQLLLGGRLAEYAYLDMDTTIARALQLAEQELA